MVGRDGSQRVEAFGEADCLPDYLHGVLGGGCEAVALARDLAELLIDTARVLPSAVAKAANARLESAVGIVPSYDPADYEHSPDDSLRCKDALARVLNISTFGVGDKVGRILSQIGI